MHIIMGLIVGIGLSAACGFRIFVPLLGMNIASLAGHLTLAPGFEWIGTWPATIAFATATIIEIGAYYIPWVDNLIDTIAIPSSIVAGTIITASQMGEVSPLLKWSLAIIAGGGVCGAIQTGTAALRATSTGTTGGFGNFLVSSIELICAVAMTFFAVVLPVLGLIVLIVGFSMLVTRISKSSSSSQSCPQ